MNNVDRAKIRTAVKSYLKINGEATAKELCYFIDGLDLRLRSRLTPSILANDLCYCADTGKNFLNVKCTRRKYDNRNVYSLEE